jgi:hypothetical protein
MTDPHQAKNRYKLKCPLFFAKYTALSVLLAPEYIPIVSL